MAESTPSDGGAKSEDEQPGQIGPSARPDREELTEESPIPIEVLKKLPPEDRRVIESLFASVTYGPVPNPLARKVTSEHIGKIIDHQDRGMQLEFEDRRDSRRWGTLVAFGLVVILAVVVLTLALTNRTAALIEVLKAIVLIAGGFGTGFGFAEYRRQRG